VVPRKRGHWQVVAAKWVVGASCRVHTGGIVMGGESVRHSISGVAVQGEQYIVTMRVVGAERRVQSCRVLVGLRRNCNRDSKQQHLIKKQTAYLITVAQWREIRREAFFCISRLNISTIKSIL
jgi:hypothetical protein